MNHLIIEEATLDHHKAILELTENETLYGGMDYLPSTLKNWLREAEPPEARRKNFVFLLKDEIVGFVSVFFLKNWTTCIKFAFRVSK